MRRPFWLAAPSYYVLAIAISVAFFFVVWGLLEDVELRSPWQTAGVSACIVLIGSVILREMVLRRRHVPLRQPAPVRINDQRKLTIERALAILSEIERKSDAANLLERSGSGHREVFELCGAFIRRIDIELASVKPASPRLAALLKGRSRTLDLHRHHTLRWAEIEARSLSGEAGSLPDAAGRASAARRAVAVVNEALVSYPAEESLIASRALLTELAVSIDVANAVEEAEKAVYSGDTGAARSFYREALYVLGYGNVQTPERAHAAARIRDAMERLPDS